MSGKLLVIGFGPGHYEHMTQRAKDAITESDVIIGYKTYVDLIEGLLTDQEIVSTGMTEEVSRAQEAVRQAEQGRKVAVISSGDAGVYGMAGLIYEVLVEKGWSEKDGVQVEVIPGISAINSCASLLGAPVMHDACTISLSDHLTPWELIAKRVEAAGQADFVIALYNPKSGRRTRQIAETQRILLKYRSPNTPVGLVKSAYREREHVVMTTLEDMLNHDIGMLTTVIIGNSTTFFYDDKMITPRGYQRKYTLDKTEQPLRPHERLRKEAEPWALNQEDEAHSPTNHEVKTLGWDTATTSNSATPGPSAVANASISTREVALEAIRRVDEQNSSQQKLEETGSNLASQHVAAHTEAVSPRQSHEKQQPIFEFAVSPGVANKEMTPQQMVALANVVGEEGTMEYTPQHYFVVRVPTDDPQAVTSQLEEVGLTLLPIGNVLKLKACDFCYGDKADSIPHAEAIQQRLGGMELPKALRIGFNGCGMACYGAVMDDIGIIYRKGKFDLFLGAKTTGRTAHTGQPVAEGIDPDEIVPLVERIVHAYKEHGHPNERFHKFFKRVKKIEGFTYQDVAPKVKVEPLPCGD